MARHTVSANPIDHARSLASAGRFGPARKAYKQVIQRFPNNSELLQEAGFVEVEAGRLKNAIAYMSKAVAITPDNPDAHMNLAEAYRLDGDKTQALKHFAQTVQLNPQDTDAHYALADLYVAQEDWTNANKHISAAIALTPEDVALNNLQGIILEQQGNLREAKSFFERSLEISPHFVEARCNLAALCAQTNLHQEAIRHFETAAQLAPLNEAQLSNLFHCYIREDQALKALEIAETLIPLAKNPEHALVLRGTAQRALGKFDAAENDYRAALNIDVNCAQAYENLGVIHRLTQSDLDHIEARISELETPDEDTLISYYYALYYGHRDAKAYDQAFAYLKQVNQLLIARSSFDKATIAKSTDRTIRIFDGPLFKRSSNFGFQEVGPIFIVGMPRSGTTLTERILAAHPQIFGGGERHDLPNLMDRTEDYPEMVSSASVEWAHIEGERIYQSMFSKAGEARFVTDKLPGNFSNIGLIKLLLPEAKIVFCKRNAMDNCLSCYEQNFESGNSYTCSLEGLGEAYRQHLRLMQHWFEVCPISVHTVHYEQLVTEPELQVRALLEYIGVDWDPACLHPEKVEHSIATASVWQARQPINPGSVERWRRYEKHLQPLIGALEAN